MPILEGTNNDTPGPKVQNQAICYFLEVHKSAPVHGLHAEMGWLNIKYHYDLCKLHY